MRTMNKMGNVILSFLHYLKLLTFPTTLTNTVNFKRAKHTFSAKALHMKRRLKQL